MKIASAVVLAGALLASMNAFANDAAAGKAAYDGKGCAGCHGADGKSASPANPTLAGRDAAFVKGALTDFKSGKRQNATMNAMAGMLNDADVANIAAYVATLKK
jgi:cytochrome c553